jgi:alpha-glucuronidase
LRAACLDCWDGAAMRTAISTERALVLGTPQSSVVAAYGNEIATLGDEGS